MAGTTSVSDASDVAGGSAEVATGWAVVDVVSSDVAEQALATSATIPRTRTDFFMNSILELDSKNLSWLADRGQPNPYTRSPPQCRGLPSCTPKRTRIPNLLTRSHLELVVSSVAEWRQARWC